MSEFDAVQTAKDLTKSFYSLFDADEKVPLHITSSDIAQRKDAVVEWAKHVNQTVRQMSARDIGTLYTLLAQKTSEGEIGNFAISFQYQGPKEPVQDRHPLLRAVDFAAHRKRSVEAYSLKYASSGSERAKEIGETNDIMGREPLFAYLFIDVEKHQDSYGEIDRTLALEAVLPKAAEFEDKVQQSTILPQALAADPSLLQTSLRAFVGTNHPRGIGRSKDNVVELMKWELVADAALKSLSLEELKDVYGFYQSQLSVSSDNNATRVVLREINSVCVNKPELKDHLKFGYRMDEMYCDGRVRHLISSSGRYPINLPEAFEKALAQSHSAAERPVPQSIRKASREPHNE